MKYIKQKSGLYELVSLIDEVAEASGESPYDIHRQIFKILCIDSWRYRNDDAPLKKNYCRGKYGINQGNVKGDIWGRYTLRS